MRLVAALLLVPLVSGCGASQFSPAAEAEIQIGMARNAELHACQAKYPKRERGKAAEGIRCVNSANDKYPPPNLADLVRLAGARNLEAAERYDAGKISDAQFDLEVATIDAEFQVAMRDRSAQNMAISAAQQQAAAAQRQAAAQAIAAGAAIMSASQPPPPQPIQLPRQTNCSTYGSRTNCTTW